MSEKHQDVIWLAGQVFLFRDFVKQAEEQGLEAVFKSCPYGDLTADEKATFEAAFKSDALRKVVEEWWQAYDAERESAAIPKAGTYWESES